MLVLSTVGLGMCRIYDTIAQDNDISQKIKRIQTIPIISLSSWFIPATAVSEQLYSRAAN